LALLVQGARAVIDSRRPLRERLLAAARERLESDEPALARSYVERALARGEDVDAPVVLALARPRTESALAASDLERATGLAGQDASALSLIGRAREELAARR